MNTIGVVASFCAALALAVPLQCLAESETRAGASVDVDQAVDGDLRAVGARVTLSAPVSGKARLTGARVEIKSGASIAKDVTVAAGSVDVKGPVQGDLRASGGQVLIDSAIGGDATVNAGLLELGPNARIAGKLRFRGETLERDPAAQVTGTVVQEAGRRHRWGGRHFGDHSAFGSFIGAAIMTSGLMLLAAILAGALPGPARRMQEELRTRPWLAALFGLMALICIPIAAVIAMVTLVGIPLGLLAILGYAALLVVGYVATAVLVSGLLLDRYKSEAAARTAWRVGAAALAMLVLSTLAHVPFVGGFLALAALVVGMGAIVGAIIHRSKGATPTIA